MHKNDMEVKQRSLHCFELDNVMVVPSRGEQ